MIAFLVVALCIIGIAESRSFPLLYPKRNVTFLGDVRTRDVPLRVLPLGDSITNGEGSSDGNGYRKLFVELASQGGPLQMIGSREGKGDIMNNNNKHDGWNGYTINMISWRSTNALRAKPNLVLLLAGTNNMHNATQASTAPAEMGTLMDKIFNESSRAVVLTGTIPVSTWPGRQPLNDQYNRALFDLVGERAAKGKHIMLVPFNTSVVTSDLEDGLHPDDDGYEKMAVTWVQAVNQAQDRGWFQEPEPGNGYVEPQSEPTSGAHLLSGVSHIWWLPYLILLIHHLDFGG